MLFSTACPAKRNTHKILEGAVQHHEQQFQGKVFDIERPPKNRLKLKIIIKTLWFASLFLFRIVNHTAADLLYKNVGIGRLASATAFRDPCAYRSIWIFWVRFLKALYMRIKNR